MHWYYEILFVLVFVLIGWSCSAKWINSFVIYSTSLNGAIGTVVGVGVLIGQITVKSTFGDMSFVARIVGPCLIFG